MIDRIPGVWESRNRGVWEIGSPGVQETGSPGVWESTTMNCTFASYIVWLLGLILQ